MNRLLGRLRVIKEISSPVGGLTLSVGSKETRFATINLDIDARVRPDIVADARRLPFKSNVFDIVFFTDVIEHLPKKDEVKALNEIYRVLKSNGILIFTTPNYRTLFTLLDPAYYLINHRHYTLEAVKKLLENTGFKITLLFTAGGIWACISNLWYCLITYPLKRLFKRALPYAPSLFQSLTDREYNFNYWKNGYTIFAKARKIREGEFRLL